MLARKMLSGRIALVTGGAAGIGRAVCQALQREGARIVVADLDIDGCFKTIDVSLLTFQFHVSLCTVSFLYFLSITTAKKTKTEGEK